jgi:hypothetical protein
MIKMVHGPKEETEPLCTTKGEVNPPPPPTLFPSRGGDQGDGFGGEAHRASEPYVLPVNFVYSAFFWSRHFYQH